MDFNDSPEEAAYRAEVRQWLEANAPKKPVGVDDMEGGGVHQLVELLGMKPDEQPLEARLERRLPGKQPYLLALRRGLRDAQVRATLASGLSLLARQLGRRQDETSRPAYARRVTSCSEGDVPAILPQTGPAA